VALSAPSEISFSSERQLPIPDVVQFPEAVEFLFHPYRYKVLHGGRGSTKSWSVARALLLKGAAERKRILCTREVQRTIQDSVHKLLSDQVDMMGLRHLYTIQSQSLKSSVGSEFIFAGLKTDPNKIKSTEGVDICWVEEAEKISHMSWEILIPTIRTPGSEIWITFSPSEKTDPTYKRFILTKPDGAMVREVNWRDNPWFPEELKKEKDYLARVDMDAYMHVWEGKCRKIGLASIFGNKCVVESFDIGKDWVGPYFGADWGFANDPTTLEKCWVGPGQMGGQNLYIEKEVYGVGIELDYTPAKFDQIPESRKYRIRADNSRPETISYLRRQGFMIKPAAKWPGSVEDGIAFIRTFERIVIHPQCIHTIEESHLYSYKVDPLTNDILPDIVDKHNHCWDAVRYAIEPIVKRKKKAGVFSLSKELPGKEPVREPREKTKRDPLIDGDEEDEN
jgi:phage terminase large subunit